MGRKVDYAEAQRLIDQGHTILSIALRFEVAPQALYDAIRRGSLVRPKQTAPAG